MVFIPKNQYKKLFTTGETLFTIDGEFYVGPYLELPDNTYYIGEDLGSLGERLYIRNNSGPDVRLLNNSQITTFKTFNPKYAEKEINYRIPVNTRVRPTNEDYQKGSMVRYFGIKIQNASYFEINKKTYDEIKAGKFIDTSLYNAGKITWALRGDTEQINGANLIRLEASYPNLKSLFPKLTEYKSQSTTENLIAKEGELVYLDGTPFPGGQRYHLHPEKGPMEGAFHKEEFHNFLKFVENVEVESIESEIITPTPTPSPQPQTPRSTPSYGRGGGY